VAQLLRVDGNLVRLETASIRDTPDFEYRAASDWLLAVELSRWSFDQGRGFEDFAATTRAKLDRAAEYQINMALMDGLDGRSKPSLPSILR